MQQLSSHALSLVGGGVKPNIDKRVYQLGFHDALWFTISGLTAKAMTDQLFAGYLLSNNSSPITKAAVMGTSAAIGLMTGYTTFLAFESHFEKA